MKRLFLSLWSVVAILSIGHDLSAQTTLTADETKDLIVVDVSDGFAGAKWGQSLAGVQEATGAKLDDSLQTRPEEEVLVKKSDDGKVETYYFFWDKRFFKFIRIAHSFPPTEKTKALLKASFKSNINVNYVEGYELAYKKTPPPSGPDVVGFTLTFEPMVVQKQLDIRAKEVKELKEKTLPILLQR